MKIMKRLIVLGIIIIISFPAFSQDSLENKISEQIGVSISPRAGFVASPALSLINAKESYEKLNTNVFSEFMFGINIGLNKKMEISTGIGYNYRFDETHILNTETAARVREYFIRVPVRFHYYMELKENVDFYIGMGPYFDILASQKYYLKDQTATKDNFKNSYGLGSYVKTGFQMNGGVKFRLNETFFIDFGVKSDVDKKSLYINPNNNPTYEYSTFGFYFALGTSID